MQIDILQFWLSTPIDYLKIPEHIRGAVIDSLLGIEFVSEVVYYSEILLLVDLNATTDAEALAQLTKAKNDIREVFKQFGYT